MDDAGLVSGGERGGDLAHVIEAEREREWRARGVFGKQAIQAFAVDGIVFVDGDDVGVVEGGGGVGFAGESTPVGGSDGLARDDF